MLSNSSLSEISDTLEQLLILSYNTKMCFMKSPISKLIVKENIQCSHCPSYIIAEDFKCKPTTFCFSLVYIVDIQAGLLENRGAVLVNSKS